MQRQDYERANSSNPNDQDHKKALGIVEKNNH